MLSFFTTLDMDIVGALFSDGSNMSTDASNLRAAGDCAHRTSPSHAELPKHFTGGKCPEGASMLRVRCDVRGGHLCAARGWEKKAG